MGKYKELQDLTSAQFKRLTGVRKETFEEMVKILDNAQNGVYRRAGRRGRLSLQDKLLMALEYLREYRTYFHLGRSYGLSESACYRACRRVEDALIKSKRFSLPGKKELLKSNIDYEIILVDAAESPIERPKKKYVIKEE